MRVHELMKEYEAWKRTNAYRERCELLTKILTCVVVLICFNLAVWFPAAAVYLVEKIMGA